MNKFLGKKLLINNLSIIIDKLSVHYTLNLLRLSRKTPKTLLTFILQKNFNVINIKKLKNSFIEIFHSSSIWLEIKKMIDKQLLSFSTEFLCRGNKNFSVLSEYLFEIYLYDLCLFFDSIYAKYNNQVFLLSNMYSSTTIFLSPMKFGKFANFSSLKEFGSFSYQNIYSFNTFRKSKKIITLKRFVSVFMYKHHFCMFFSGSKNFSYFIQQKIFSFVKSNLHFDILECVTGLFFVKIFFSLFRYRE